MPQGGTLYGSVKGLFEKRHIFPKVMSVLKLLSFKDIELEFLNEYCQLLTTIPIALDRMQGDKNFHYFELMPYLK